MPWSPGYVAAIPMSAGAAVGVRNVSIAESNTNPVQPILANHLTTGFAQLKARHNAQQCLALAFNAYNRLWAIVVLSAQSFFAHDQTRM